MKKDYSISYRVDVAVPDVVAYELNRSGSGMEDLLKEAVYGDNQGGNAQPQYDKRYIPQP
ncbi:hypothetical protein ACFSQ7_45490 [Paenibacillus rhizoplanae]